MTLVVSSVKFTMAAATLLVLTAVLSTTSTYCEAFAVMRQPPSFSLATCSSRQAFFTTSSTTSTTALFSEAEDAASAGENSQQQTEEDEQEQEEEKVQEDPEVTSLKKSIADLEGKLKEKQSTIQYLKDQADQYSKSGYARKVAEMETMRRTRSSAASSNKEASIANVLRDFLPVVDKLDMLREKYGDDEFGKQYVALAGNMKTAFSQMGVTEYQAGAPGTKLDRSRVLAVEEVYSTEYPKDTIVEPLKPGMELKGNVVRLAECVASLGEEAPEEEQEEEAQEEGGAEEEESEE